MLDYEYLEFDKTFRLTSKKQIKISSKFELKRIRNIISEIESGNRPTGGVSGYDKGALSLGGEHIHNKNGYLNLEKPKYVPNEFYESATKGKLKKYDLLICKDGALTGKVALVRDELKDKNAMINEHVFIIRCDKIITQKYLYFFLFSNEGQKILNYYKTGASVGGINQTKLGYIEIPMPSTKIQKKVVSDLESADEEYNNSRMKLKDYKNNLTTIFKKYGILKDDKVRIE